MESSLLVDIGLSVITATLFAYIVKILKQPLILGYIAAGILIGPVGLGLIKDQHSIEVLSELGLAFLMFIIGLEIDLKKLIKAGKVVIIAGLVKVVLCGLLGFVVATWLGYTGLTAAYVAVIFCFSSTLVTVKLLSDKSELDTIAGRITLGILLLEDVISIFVLGLQSNITNPSILPISFSLAKGAALVLVSMLATRYLLPSLFRFVAKLPEVLLLSTISWCFLVSWLAMKAGFSIAMGALIAGVSISNFPYNLDVLAKIRALRDFFVTLFFVSLGMQVVISSSSIITSALVISFFVILSSFFTIIPTLRLLQYGYRFGILSAISLAQISEFALVIVALGYKLGHISQDIVSLTAIVLIITATISTYMTLNNHSICGFLLELLKRMGIRESASTETPGADHKGRSLVLLGCHRVGSSLVESLKKRYDDLLVVDFSPEVEANLKAQNIPFVYADISHMDTLEEINIREAKVVVSSISDDFLRGTSNIRLLRHIKSLNPEARVIVTAETIKNAIEMYKEGADYVLIPRILSANYLTEIIDIAISGRMDELKKRELEELENRREVLD
ncbi:MAG TPA: cation:proton antiporter [Thermodesulfobacteriota bacterium]|nr:cation:proton antiporter [Thermodesulfobacteriota bacterium]